MVETAVVVVAGELTIDEIVEWLHRHRKEITAHEVDLIAKVSQDLCTGCPVRWLLLLLRTGCPVRWLLLLLRTAQ